MIVFHFLSAANMVRYSMKIIAASHFEFRSCYSSLTVNSFLFHIQCSSDCKGYYIFCSLAYLHFPRCFQQCSEENHSLSSVKWKLRIVLLMSVLWCVKVFSTYFLLSCICTLEPLWKHVCLLKMHLLDMP